MRLQGARCVAGRLVIWSGIPARETAVAVAWSQRQNVPEMKRGDIVGNAKIENEFQPATFGVSFEPDMRLLVVKFFRRCAWRIDYFFDCLIVVERVVERARRRPFANGDSYIVLVEVGYALDRSSFEYLQRYCWKRHPFGRC